MIVNFYTKQYNDGARVILVTKNLGFVPYKDMKVKYKDSFYVVTNATLDLDNCEYYAHVRKVPINRML